MTEYKPKTNLMKDGAPKWYFNKGWRINLKNWEKQFKYPDRWLLRLRSALEALKLSANWMIVEFDPEWKGRFDNCVNGSYIMFTCSIEMEDGRVGYIDLRGKGAGANNRLLKAKDIFCSRNNIPLLVLTHELRSDEMQWKIERFRREKNRAPN